MSKPMNGIRLEVCEPTKGIRLKCENPCSALVWRSHETLVWGYDIILPTVTSTANVCFSSPGNVSNRLFADATSKIASMGVWYYPSYGHKHSEYLLFSPRKPVESIVCSRESAQRSSRGDESLVWGLNLQFHLGNSKERQVLERFFSDVINDATWCYDLALPQVHGLATLCLWRHQKCLDASLEFVPLHYDYSYWTIGSLWTVVYTAGSVYKW